MLRTGPQTEGGFAFDSLYVEDKDLKPGQPRLITADHEMVVPVGKVIELDVVSQDVIHSFSVPSFGVKIDAIPGRLNKAWFKADHEGMFYGQCSNICGIDHAFMPNVLKGILLYAVEVPPPGCGGNTWFVDMRQATQSPPESLRKRVEALTIAHRSVSRPGRPVAVHELLRSGGRKALVTMCCGGGLGTGTLLERA